MSRGAHVLCKLVLSMVEWSFSPPTPPPTPCPAPIFSCLQYMNQPLLSTTIICLGLGSTDSTARHTSPALAVAVSLLVAHREVREDERLLSRCVVSSGMAR